MDDIYIHVLQHLNYDMPTAQRRFEKCGGFSGDTMHMGFKNAVKQAETHPPTDFKANLLMLSDRLYSAAVGLHYYFLKCTGAKVDVAYNEKEAAAADNAELDYLIIVGYQYDERNYNVIKKLRKKEMSPHIVMWAIPDQMTRSICQEYRVQHIFDRNKPSDEFVAFLKSIRPLPRV